MARWVHSIGPSRCVRICVIRLVADRVRLGGSHSLWIIKYSTITYSPIPFTIPKSGASVRLRPMRLSILTVYSQTWIETMQSSDQIRNEILKRKLLFKTVRQYSK